MAATNAQQPEQNHECHECNREQSGDSCLLLSIRHLPGRHALTAIAYL